MKKILFMMLIFVLLFAAGSIALTWQEAVELAQKNNNEIISTQKQLDSAQWSYYKTYSSFFPQLSASLSMTEIFQGTIATSEKNYSYGLNATQYLFRGMQAQREHQTYRITL